MCPKLAIRPKRFKEKVITLNPSDLSHLIIAEEFIIHKSYDLERVPFEPALIIDCGAHIGLFTLLARAHFPTPRIIAFEPAPENVTFLKEHAREAGGDIEVIEAAVSDRDGVARFLRRMSFAGSLQLDESESPGTYEVRTVDLKKVLRGKSGGNLLLKLDIEGSEEIVLPAIVDLLPPRCAIFLEVHAGEESWQRATSLLETRGFRTRKDREHEDCVDGFAIRCA